MKARQNPGGTKGSKGVSQAEWIKMLLERHERPLVTYAARITGNLELSRDVVQDVFVRLCRMKRRRIEKRMPAWLYRVCRNRALDLIKREGRVRPFFEDEIEHPAGEDPTPREITVAQEELRLVREVLDRLPPEQKEAVYLKFNAGLTFREISRVTGRSVGTVNNLLTAALSGLRRRLRVELDLAREG